MKLKVLVIAVLLIAGGVAIVASVGGLPLTGTAEATQYLTANATTGDVSDQVAATGSIAAAHTYALGFGAAPVAATDSSTAAGTGTWTVDDVKAEVGQQVKAGDVLAKASTTDLKSQLGQARTSLQAAQIQEKAANKSLNDAIANSSGTAAIRQAKTAWLNAVNARRQAQSQVYSLEDQIRFATLKAPVDGIVTAVNIVKGLDSTGTAITLDSAGYQVTADVVETDVSSMSVGQDATVTVGAIDATIQGKVSAIAPSGTASSNGVVQYPVTVTLTGAPKALRNGMTADITIVTAAANNVLTIPTAALRGTTGNYSVQVLGADGKPTITPVTVGLVTNTTAEIKSGLTEGAQVVTGTASDRIASTTNSNNGFGGGGRFGNGGVFVGGPGVNVKGP